MKLLHTSDWHLGMTFRGGISYEEDQRFMVDAICKVAQEEKVQGILLAGDVFDKSIASQEAMKLYDEIMTKICGEMGIPVYMIAGNHDGAERIAACSQLLKKSGLYIAGALRRDPFIVNVGDVDIYLLPWISTDKVTAIYPEDAEKVGSMEDAYRVVLDKYRAGFVPGHRHIIVSHSYIVNAETSVSDRAAEIGKAAMIPSDVFEGFDYVALGHLHGPQQIDEHIWYSGTPMAYSFGKEEEQVKGVIILDTDTLEKKKVPLPQLHVRRTLTETLDKLLAAQYEKKVREGYLRLEVTDEYVGLETMAALRERYPNYLEVEGQKLSEGDSAITMTMEELEGVQQHPETVFEKFMEDSFKKKPDDHLKELFLKALRKYEKGVTEE